MYPRYDASWVVLGVRTFSLVYFWYCSCLTEVGAHSGLEEELEDLDIVPVRRVKNVYGGPRKPITATPASPTTVRVRERERVSWSAEEVRYEWAPIGSRHG